MASYYVNATEAAGLTVDVTSVVQQCDALMDRVAAVYAGHYHRESIAAYLRGARELASMARFALEFDRDAATRRDAEVASA